MARLSAAVRRQPEGAQELRASAHPAPRPHPAPQPAPQPRPAPAAAPTPEPGGERGRFGINSLIHRMAGGGAETQRAEPASPLGQERMDENDRLRDVPAFLRRQAN
jgi:cell division protein FtsZ